MDNRAGRILVIGPEGASRVMLQQRLEALGGQVHLGDEQSRCYDMVKKIKPDLVFVELGLETELPPSFPDLLRNLKADPSFSSIPVIAYGPPEEMHQIRQAVEVGVEDYLLTPISPTLIKALYNDYLDISRQRQNEYNRSVREGFLKIERDVEIARQIQLDFLPNALPEPENYDIAARFHPARQVAGDWYDAFYLTNKRRVGFIVGDVCDKGVGSALFMALFRSLIRAFAQQNLSLRWMDTRTEDWLSAEPIARRKSLPSTGTTAVKNAIEITNNYLCENHAELNYFATMFFGILDPATGIVTYVNGGHPPMVVIDRDGKVKERLKPTGPAVGVFPGVEFEIGQTSLEPGETLFIFSDGCTDARDPANKLFGEKRLLSLLDPPAATSLELLDRIDHALYAHIDTADQFDDITMMAIMHKINPEEEIS